MNIKKLALLSILALSAATVRPDAVVQAEATTMENVADVQNASAVPVKQIWNVSSSPAQYAQYLNTTIIPGVGVGYLTGASIGYMSGKLFDATVVPMLHALVHEKSIPSCVPAFALARLAAQVGSKWYWEKPLRNKLLSWIQSNIKSMYSYTWQNNADSTEILDGSLCNEECGKTLARLFAWLGLVQHVRTI